MEEFYKKYNTEDILSSLVELQINPYSELHDIKLPLAEFMISNLVRYNIKHTQLRYTWNSYLELLKIGELAFRAPINELIGEVLQLQDSDQETKKNFEKSMMMRLKNQSFRGDAYFHQLIAFSNSLYSPFNEQFLKKLGFSYNVCENVLVSIFKKYLQREKKAVKRQHNVFVKLRMAWRFFIKNEPLINPSISEDYIFRVYKKDLYANYDKSEIDCLLEFLSISIGDDKIAKVAMSDFKPLYERPFIDFGDFIYLSLPQITLLNLPKLFHYSFIATNIFDKDTIEAYKKHRGDVVEEATCKYLKKFFDKDKIFRSLKYPPNTKSMRQM